MRRGLQGLLMVALLVLAGCGSEEQPAAEAESPAAESPTAEEASPTAEEESPAAEEESPAAEEGAATVAVADSDLGELLVDAEGRTLYLFENDTDGTSTCYDDCAGNWPALEAEGEPQAGEGVDAALLGTVERDDGSTQVTYADQPLYYFSGDSAPGDTNGQGIGDVWYVVAPDGSAIDTT